MRIGIVAPFTPHYIAAHLDTPPSNTLGLGGSPINILCDELLNRGKAVDIFTLDPQATESYELTGPNVTVHIAPYRQRAFHRARDFFSQERIALKRAIMRASPDVLHAHWTYEFAWAALDTGIPTLVTAHDAPLAIARRSPDWYRLVRLVMAAHVLNRCTHLAAVSPYVAQHLRRWQFTRQEISIVPNGLPERDFLAVRDRSAESGPVFAAVLTGWGRIKNGSTLLKAFAKVKRNLPTSRLLLFGTGHGLQDAGFAWAKSQGLCAGVEFVGHIPYESLKARLVQEADILVHPSREESHGMALIEAMAMSIPVIGGMDSGAVPWTLGFGSAGLLVDVNSSEALSSAMQTLGEDPGLRQSMGRKAHEYAFRHFRITAIADTYMNIYERCRATSKANR